MEFVALYVGASVAGTCMWWLARASAEGERRREVTAYLRQVTGCDHHAAR